MLTSDIGILKITLQNEYCFNLNFSTSYPKAKYKNRKTASLSRNMHFSGVLTYY